MAVYSGLTIDPWPDDDPDALRLLWRSTTVAWLTVPLDADTARLATRRDRLARLGFGLLPLHEATVGEGAYASGEQAGATAAARAREGGLEPGSALYLTVAGADTLADDELRAFWVAWATAVRRAGYAAGLVTDAGRAAAASHVASPSLVMVDSAPSGGTDESGAVGAVDAVEVRNPTASEYTGAALWRFTSPGPRRFRTDSGGELALRASVASSLMANPAGVANAAALVLGQAVTRPVPPAISGALAVTPALDQAVRRFIDTFHANPDLIRNGQFQLTRACRVQLEVAISQELAAHGDQRLITLGAELVEQIRVDSTSTKAADAAAALRVAVKESALPGSLPATWAGLTAGVPADWPATRLQTIWGDREIRPTPSIGVPSLAKQRACYHAEASLCFRTEAALARKFVHATGAAAIRGPAITHGAGLDARIKEIQGAGDVLTVDPLRLAVALDEVRRVIDAGHPVLASCTSGIRHDTTPWPTPEHYLLLFAYDQDLFAFWDSVPGDSTIRSLGWGPGFGVLMHRDGRLSTAVGDEDLRSVGDDGDHRAEPTRHRYQVYQFQRVP